MLHTCVLYGSWGSTFNEMRLNHTLSVFVCSKQCDRAMLYFNLFLQFSCQMKETDQLTEVIVHEVPILCGERNYPFAK